jgi:hypothetical protein
LVSIRKINTLDWTWDITVDHLPSLIGTQMRKKTRRGVYRGHSKNWFLQPGNIRCGPKLEKWLHKQWRKDPHVQLSCNR